jgi:hypothetical protein
MIAFIDTHGDQFGVQFICRVLRAAIVGFLSSRGYRAAKTRPPSDRAIRDELLIDELKTVHHQNCSVYGVLKMHQAMKRRGWSIGREQTRRLMKRAGLRGVQRGKPVFTTISDPEAATPADLVQRRFAAEAPNRLWVADISFRAPGRGCATPHSSPTPARTGSSGGPSRPACAPRTCRCKHSIMLCGRQIRNFLSWCIIPTP